MLADPPETPNVAHESRYHGLATGAARVRVALAEVQDTMRGLFGAAVMAVALGLLATPAEAYLDPGTGSYVFQMVAAEEVA